MAVLKTNFGRLQEWRNEAIAALVAELTDLGQEACLVAIEKKNRGYQNQKYNLRDSIGSAVYVDGKLVKSSKRYAYSKSSRGPYKDKGNKGHGEWKEGRDAIDEYWRDNQTIPNKQGTVELVVVAATFYAGILQDRGIQVISAATDFLEREMRTYKSYKPKLRSLADEVRIS